MLISSSAPSRPSPPPPHTSTPPSPDVQHAKDPISHQLPLTTQAPPPVTPTLIEKDIHNKHMVSRSNNNDNTTTKTDTTTTNTKDNNTDSIATANNNNTTHVKESAHEAQHTTTNATTEFSSSNSMEAKFSEPVVTPKDPTSKLKTASESIHTSSTSPSASNMHASIPSSSETSDASAGVLCRHTHHSEENEDDDEEYNDSNANNHSLAQDSRVKQSSTAASVTTTTTSASIPPVDSKLKKKRFRRSYNCGPCKTHKIKCDMKTPCGNCEKYDRVDECLKSPPNPPTYQQYLVKQQRKRKYLEKRYNLKLPNNQFSLDPLTFDNSNNNPMIQSRSPDSTIVHHHIFNLPPQKNNYYPYQSLDNLANNEYILNNPNMHPPNINVNSMAANANVNVNMNNNNFRNYFPPTNPGFQQPQHIPQPPPPQAMVPQHLQYQQQLPPPPQPQFMQHITPAYNQPMPIPMNVHQQQLPPQGMPITQQQQVYQQVTYYQPQQQGPPPQQQYMNQFPNYPESNQQLQPGFQPRARQYSIPSSNGSNNDNKSGQQYQTSMMNNGNDGINSANQFDVRQQQQQQQPQPPPPSSVPGPVAHGMIRSQTWTGNPNVNPNVNANYHDDGTGTSNVRVGGIGNNMDNIIEEKVSNYNRPVNLVGAQQQSQDSQTSQYSHAGQPPLMKFGSSTTTILSEHGIVENRSHLPSLTSLPSVSSTASMNKPPLPRATTPSSSPSSLKR